MIAAAADCGVRRDAAEELARNWLAAEPVTGPDVVSELASMIVHRQRHFPERWRAWSGQPTMLALAMITSGEAAA